jgi:hypothetical protein
MMRHDYSLDRLSKEVHTTGAPSIKHWSRHETNLRRLRRCCRPRLDGIFRPGRNQR